MADQGEVIKGEGRRLPLGKTPPEGEVERPRLSAPAAQERNPKSFGTAGPESSLIEVLLDRSLSELVRYYRHSSCGRLSRGLIHRMNTPLQILSFQLELLEQKSQEEWRILPEVRQPVGEKLQALQRYRLQKIRQFRLELENLQALAQAIVLQGSYEDSEERLELDLNELCRRELDLYQSQPFFNHQVEKRFHFQEDLPPIRGHYLDFSQSFRNLLDNALEAMEDAERRILTVATYLEDGWRLLCLGDTGPGIPPELLPRLREPFFTTKKGRAGLGLFMARRLLAPYGGEIRITSDPGKTWVTVALPV